MNKKVMGCEDKKLTKKEQTAQRNNRLLERLAQEKGRGPVNVHINYDLSISSSHDGLEKEFDNNFVPATMKVGASLSK